jgi:hypothetical protein
VETGTPSTPERSVVPPTILPYLPIQAEAVSTPSSSPKRKGSVDPFAEPGALDRFTADAERLEKVIEGLDKPSLNGPTHLDLKWKELMDAQASSLLHFICRSCVPLI